MSIISQIGIGDIEIARRWFGSRSTMYCHNLGSNARYIPFDTVSSAPDHTHYIPPMSVKDGVVLADISENILQRTNMTPKLHLKFDDYSRLPFRLELMYPRSSFVVIGQDIYVYKGGSPTRIAEVIDLRNAPHTMQSLEISIPSHIKQIITDDINIMSSASLLGMYNVDNYDICINLVSKTDSPPIKRIKAIEYDGDISRLRVRDNGEKFSLKISHQRGCNSEFLKIMNRLEVGKPVEDQEAINYIKEIQKTMPGVSSITDGLGSTMAYDRERRQWWCYVGWD